MHPASGLSRFLPGRPHHARRALACGITALVLCISFSSPSPAGDQHQIPTWRDHPLLEQFGVDRSDLPSNLYLVKSPLPLAARRGIRVHGNDGSVYLVSGDESAIRELRERRCAIIPLDRIGTGTPPPVREWTRIDTPDPLIQEMVSQVAWDPIIRRINRLVDFGTRHTLANNQGRVAKSIRDTLRSFGLDARYHPFMIDDLKRWNVEAVQPGRRFPNTSIVICAHFDSYSKQISQAPGADDNASGTSAVMAVAEILSHYEFDCTIRYLCFSGEEQGLFGSDAYARAARENDLDLIGALNYDMVGYWPSGVKRDLEIEANQASVWLAEAVINAADLYTTSRYDLHIYDWAWWGDHYSFWVAGLPAVNHEEAWDWWDPDFNPYYHTLKDLPEYLDSLFMENNVKIAVASVATLAGAGSVQRVSFDMRPGSCPNPFNPSGRGTVHGLLLGSDEFTIGDIILSSLSLGRATPVDSRMADMGSVDRHNGHPCADRTPDGYDDLLLTFSTQDVAAAIGPVAPGDTVQIHLGGRLTDGTFFEGTDALWIVGGGDGPALADEAHTGGSNAESDSSIPVRFALHQNVPNPFNPRTTIKYDVPAGGGRVSLRIYDVGGRLIRTLAQGMTSAGEKRIIWNGLNDAGYPVATGIYLYRLTGPGFEETRKMILLK